MSVLTKLENYDTFYITLCFFITIIVVAVLIFCIVMTEIIIYDTKIDEHALNTIAKKLKLSKRGQHHYKTLNQRKWNKPINRRGHKQLSQKNHKEELWRKPGLIVEQAISLLFEAMITELNNQNKGNAFDNNLTVAKNDESRNIDGDFPQDLSLRQNTLRLLIKSLSNLKLQLLEQLVSPNVFPTITYKDILNRLKRLDAAKQKISLLSLNVQDHDKINKKLRKGCESESIILENLKKISCNEESTDSKLLIPVKEINITPTSAKSTYEDDMKLSLNGQIAQISLKQCGDIKDAITGNPQQVEVTEEPNEINKLEEFKSKPSLLLSEKTSDLKINNEEKSPSISANSQLIHKELCDVKQTVAKSVSIESSPENLSNEILLDVKNSIQNL